MIGDYQHKEVLKAGCAYFFVIELVILLCAFAHTGGTSASLSRQLEKRIIQQIAEREKLEEIISLPSD